MVDDTTAVIVLAVLEAVIDEFDHDTNALRGTARYTD